MERFLVDVFGNDGYQSLLENRVVLGLVAVFLVSRNHFYRTLRPFVVPVVVAVLLQRAVTSSHDKTILTELIQFVEKWNLPVLTHLLKDISGLIIVVTIVSFVNKISSYNLLGLKKVVFDYGFSLVKSIPPVKKAIEKEQFKMEEDMDKSLKSRSRILEEPIKALPAKGRSPEAILGLMKKATDIEDVAWETGRISGAVYHGIRGHQEMLNKAFSLYSLGNPLHPDIWPSGMKFESEIVMMAASLVNGGLNSVCGCTTSGGTESIILAIKAHRDYYESNFGITEPEMVVSTSAHAAVDKACDMLKIKLIKIEMDPVTYKADIARMRACIGPNTIMMYSSAPSYPQGVIDPISELSKIAVQYGIGLHVDCCLGGFVLPFAKKLGHKVPDFDFSLPGVTSMSMDTHKFGYALKGTSVLLFRHKQLRHAQYFCYADWTGGMYTTPTIAGSRSLGMIAQTWASLVSLGEEGYLKHTRDILDSVKIIADGIKTIPHIKLIGGAEAMIVCFAGSKNLNVYAVADKMSKKKWSLNSHQNPPCVHLCCTVTHKGHEQQFLEDLRSSVEELMKDPSGAAKEGNAAIYGMTSALPSGPVNEMLKTYNDCVLKI